MSAEFAVLECAEWLRDELMEVTTTTSFDPTFDPILDENHDELVCTNWYTTGVFLRNPNYGCFESGLFFAF